ncbi:hypothetical protein CAEBREN_04130 [Caenorhabditis brenneri]|uniref:Uncharacterized protein n=1 Tax=Caenorhabditis brenneri TaxID=135651 RepID=G0MRK1_CAEBE|nr:hypothetical protein CAEBREN_04130 [Caenorhabditis brenneri]
MKRDAKNHPRNRLMECYIRGAPTYSAIVKIDHNDAPLEAQDFEPCIVYSMNRKKRWEIDQDMANKKEVIIHREISELRYAWWSLKDVHFSHCFYNSRPVGSNEEVAGYHIIKMPKNFKKVFDKKCIRDIGWRSPEILGTATREHLTPIQYELKENGTEWDRDEGPEFLEEEEDALEAETEKPTGFYNFEDYFVVKKQRKQKGWITV